MDLNDMYEDDRSEGYNYFVMEQLEHEQPLISKKSSTNAYSVEREYVNSKAYHDKFERLPVNKEVQEKLYIQAGRLLEFVDGQNEEHLLAINARTGVFIVDNFEREGNAKGTGFNDDEAKKLDTCKDGIILMHNHSLNGRPSAQDLITYLNEERVKVSIIVCHDGTMYGIYDVNSEFPTIFDEYVKQEKYKTNDIEDAKRKAMTKLYTLNDRLSDRHKLFKYEKM